MDGQLEEILDELVGPPTSSPGEGVVLHELIKTINSTHVTVVVTNDSGSLHCHLLVGHSTLTSGLSPLYDVLGDGLMTGGDHGHQSDPLPTDDEDSPLTTPLELATLQLLLRILAKSLEDSGGSTRQPKGTTDVNAFVIQFLGQGHRVIVIIHKQVVSMFTETIHKAEDSVKQRTENPGVDGEVDDATSVGLRNKELYIILLGFLGL